VCEKGEKRTGELEAWKERNIYEAGASYSSQPLAFVDSNNWDHLSGATISRMWSGMEWEPYDDDGS